MRRTPSKHRRKNLVVICPCGTSFHPWQREAQFCSVACRQEARRPKLPRLFVCANPRCERVVEVSKPYEQKRRKFCSQRCNAIVNRNILRASHALGGLRSGQTRRARFLARLEPMTDKVEIFRYGYKCGLQSKTRQLQKKGLISMYRKRRTA